MRGLPDAALVARAREGCRDAASELFTRYWGDAWRAAAAILGRRDLADDVAQDAFIKAFAALGRFDERRPFAPWLHRIVVNRALDVLRRERRMPAVHSASESDSDAAPPDDGAFLRLLAPLAPERRAVCVLRFGLGYTPTEIATMLDVPVGTVNSRLSRALRQLRDAGMVCDV